ncbi:MAG: hypothetical protein MJA84_16510 [Firmicutes bacterium]|nr:hypothetical protein [Bacillota bacterium]
MGNLTGVWTDLPADDDEAVYKSEFARIFRANWEDVLMGGEKPFRAHLHWDGYLAVRDVRTADGLTLANLPGFGSGEAQILNIIV